MTASLAGAAHCEGGWRTKELTSYYLRLSVILLEIIRPEVCSRPSSKRPTLRASFREGRALCCFHSTAFQPLSCFSLPW